MIRPLTWEAAERVSKETPCCPRMGCGALMFGRLIRDVIRGPGDPADVTEGPQVRFTCSAGCGYAEHIRCAPPRE